jgi:hypothetical protein
MTFNLFEGHGFDVADQVYPLLPFWSQEQSKPFVIFWILLTPDQLQAFPIFKSVLLA